MIVDSIGAVNVRGKNRLLIMDNAGKICENNLKDDLLAISERGLFANATKLCPEALCERELVEKIVPTLGKDLISLENCKNGTLDIIV